MRLHGILLAALLSACAAPASEAADTSSAAAAEDAPKSLSRADRTKRLEALRAGFAAAKDDFVTLQAYSEGTEADEDSALGNDYEDPTFSYWAAEETVVYQFAKPKGSPEDKRVRYRFYTNAGQFIGRCELLPPQTALGACSVER